MAEEDPEIAAAFFSALSTSFAAIPSLLSATNITAFAEAVETQLRRVAERAQIRKQAGRSKLGHDEEDERCVGAYRVSV